MIDRDTIIKLAREVADPNTADVVFDDLITLNFGEMERFAALVAAHEREQCAKVCSDRAMLCEREAQRLIENEEHDEVSAVLAMAWNVSVCAAAIRARSST